MPHPTEDFSLKTFPLPVRVVLSTFLISVGLGYFSALVQLHFQHAAPGELMPGVKEAEEAYAGSAHQSHMLRLLEADVGKPFNGAGTMRPAFTTRSAGWNKALQEIEAGSQPNDGLVRVEDPESGKTTLLKTSQMVRLLREQGDGAFDRESIDQRKRRLERQFAEDPEWVTFNGDGKMWPAFFHRSPGWKKTRTNAAQAMQMGEMLSEREGERLAMLEFAMHAGVPRERVKLRAAFDSDRFELQGDLRTAPLTAEFHEEEGQKHYVKIRTLIGSRCARCHSGLGKKGADAIDLSTAFRLTDRSFDQMKKDPIPAEILDKLADLKDQDHENEEALVAAVADVLPRPAVERYKKTIVDVAHPTARFNFFFFASAPVVQVDEVKANNKAERLARLHDEREGERQALLAWIRAGAKEEEYKSNRMELTGEAAKLPLSPQFDEKVGDVRYAAIQSILEARCVRCHTPDAGGAAGQYPLDSYADLKPYLESEKTQGMSLPKLAQTTHVHLLGFSMLFALTGLVFSMSSFPGWVRAIFGPWTLIAQIIDISCWWLGRADPIFAKVIAVTGGLVAMGLMIQIVGSLMNMYRAKGKIVVAVLLLAGAVGVGVLFVTVVQPQLQREKGTTAAKK